MYEDSEIRLNKTWFTHFAITVQQIFLMTDFYYNNIIPNTVKYFWFCRQGLSDVINLDWLRMFSYRDLQTLISGADTEINVDDLVILQQNNFIVVTQIILQYQNILVKINSVK